MDTFCRSDRGVQRVTVIYTLTRVLTHLGLTPELSC